MKADHFTWPQLTRPACRAPAKACHEQACYKSPCLMRCSYLDDHRLTYSHILSWCAKCYGALPTHHPFAGDAQPHPLLSIVLHCREMSPSSSVSSQRVIHGQKWADPQLKGPLLFHFRTTVKGHSSSRANSRVDENFIYIHIAGVSLSAPSCLLHFFIGSAPKSTLQ